jgi:hypothetical protein
MTSYRFIMRMLISALAYSLVAATLAMAQSRGELLYTTHCITCHTTEIHWRDKSSVSTWFGLKFQVQRWQEVAALAWSEPDILDVTRYLNDSIYHFEQTVETACTLSQPGNLPVCAVHQLPPPRLP